MAVSTIEKNRDGNGGVIFKEQFGKGFLTRWHLDKDPKEMREQAMRISEGRQFQAEGTK